MVPGCQTGSWTHWRSTAESLGSTKAHPRKYKWPSLVQFRPNLKSSVKNSLLLSNGILISIFDYKNTFQASTFYNRFNEHSSCQFMNHVKCQTCVDCDLICMPFDRLEFFADRLTLSVFNLCKPKLYVQLQTNFTDKRGQKNQKKQVWSMGCHKNLIVINVYVWHLI